MIARLKSQLNLLLLEIQGLRQAIVFDSGSCLLRPRKDGLLQDTDGTYDDSLLRSTHVSKLELKFSFNFLFSKESLVYKVEDLPESGGFWWWTERFVL